MNNKILLGNSSQRGWTVWTMLLSVALIVFFSLLLLKLVPHYMDSYKLKEALEQIAEDPRVASMTRNQIIRDLSNILYIDYGGDIVDLRESLAVEKDKGIVTISVVYEVVEPLAWNVNALLEFDTRVDVSL